MAKLDKYHGFVVSGSPYDAYGDDYWILKLCSLLRILYAKEKKVLGVCFGHQVLCRALGGKVRKSSTGWDIGVRGVSIVKDCFLDDVMEVDGFEGQASVEIPKSLAIIECHQDEVSEVPAGAEIISVSEKTGVEMFTFDGHVMGIQGHPEYTKDILCNLIDRLLNNGCIEKTTNSRAPKIASQMTCRRKPSFVISKFPTKYPARTDTASGTCARLSISGFIPPTVQLNSFNF
ncbi:hypothetical protein SAY87_022915 [Trapa incisa]|uniref:Glutamine amidotransferase domain-containing protein n=1 Tax=Trapa incisa TaxID=236973 RepID=A0AAN7Q678_9MYRT|nr:hypothetical protein SAY87_022915 [Trapa incisa]